MGPENVLMLSANQLLSDRPFTQPEHIPPERLTMCAMVDSLCQLIESRPDVLRQPRPIFLYQEETGGRQQRLVINRPERLTMGHPVTVVGFFGQKLERADLLPLRNEFDQALIAEFPKHPDLLSYSTLELADGNFGNLVLFARSEAKNHWNSCTIHARAVRELAPEYYASVRLYNGVLPRGLAASRALRLTRVKYYDYTTQPVWRALRKLYQEPYAR